MEAAPHQNQAAGRLPASLIQGDRAAAAALLTMWENEMSECAPKAGVFKAVV